MPAAAYNSLADEIAAAINSGRMQPGDRLPTQREFAFTRKIAVSTVSRVYAELLRRGLIVGEVGRGTFVAAPRTLPRPTETLRTDDRIDLEYNFPICEGQTARIAKSLARLDPATALDRALRPLSGRQTRAAQQAAADMLRVPGFSPDPGNIILTGSGRQSVAAAMASVVPVGGRLGVEAMTYPSVKRIAARLGVTLVPIAMDEAGVRPDAIERAHRATPLAAVYIQPLLHNPYGINLSAGRRDEIVRIARAEDFILIEDLVYGFLADGVPMAAQAPERCFIVESLSKRIAPGIALGLLYVPEAWRDRAATTVRGGAWMPAGLAVEAGIQLMTDGTAAVLATEKRADAGRRQRLVAECLAGFEILADPRAFHAWLVLPKGWRSEAFVAAAARLGIAVSPSSAYAATPGHAPNGVRLALGLPTMEQLRHALTTIARLARSGPDEADASE